LGSEFKIGTPLGGAAMSEPVVPGLAPCAAGEW
jgi:hypothetical protein